MEELGDIFTHATLELQGTQLVSDVLTANCVLTSHCFCF